MTATADSKVAAAREAHSAAGPWTARAVMTAGEMARLKPVDNWNRYVHYAVDLPALTALGTDLLAAVLR